MAPASYSFIDIAVLDEVRTRFASGDALAILSTDLETVIWANGPGAGLLGYPDIEAAIGAPARLPSATRRQIAAAPDFPRIGRDRPLMLRLGGGFRGTPVAMRVGSLTLPDGETALLLAHPAAPEASHEASERAIGGFEAAGHFAALVDPEGVVAAASPGFDRLGIPVDVLRDLAAAARADENRLVKRLVAGAHRFPAGMAQLTDTLHLLVVVDEPQPEPDAEETAAAADTGTGPAAGVARPDQPRAAETEDMAAVAGQGDLGHEGWYFGRTGDDGSARDPGVAVPRPAVPGGESPAAPVRFVWRTDEEARFTAVSEAFATAVGAAAADIIGKRFGDVAAAFGLDAAGEIAALMERRDTWSGRTVMWPLAGTTRSVPVDLAALPAYDRDRVFQGFRGFGVVRLAEAADDPRALGLTLTSDDAAPAGAKDGASMPVAGPGPADAEPDAAKAGGSAPADKVIRLAEHRPPARQQRPAGREDGLSQTEQNAFREIADRLRRDSAGDAPTGAETGPSAEAPPADDARPEAAPSLGAGETAARAPAVAFLPSAFSGMARERGGVGVDPAILSRLPIAILIHAGDVLHYANQEFLALTGYPDLDALARQGGLGALFADPYESGSAPEAEGRTLPLRTAEGEEIPVRAHLQSVPWNGGKALLLALRPAAEEAAPPAAPAAGDLRMRIEEMRTIIDTATDGVVIIDNDGLVRSISRPAEALFGFDSADVAGRPFSALFAIESRRAAEDYLNSLSDNGVASVLNDGREVIGRESRGRFIPLFMTIGRLPNDSGFCAVVRDITQWKRAEEELIQARSQAEHSSSQKSEFLARVSHEIRTPLNAIIGFSELMLDEKFGPVGNDRYRDYLRDINRSGNHVLDLVNDLLDISKIEAGEQEMHHEAVSLNDTLGETVAMMQPQANRERVIIRSSLASHLPEVVADLRSVRQIALNILSNAVRYTPAGGQVIVSTAYEPNGAVVMRVRDTGLGMSPAELDQALKPFKQLNTLKRRRGDGTGLGLPLTRAMVEANRARFSIESTPGKGTLVEIVFPPTRVLAD